MLLPATMPKAIADAFYDKTFTVARTTHTVDAEGGAVTTTGTPSTFTGNVQYSLDDRVRQAYGISETVDLAITTDVSNDIRNDDLLTYNGNDYVVISAKKSDSHQLVIARRG